VLINNEFSTPQSKLFADELPLSAEHYYGNLATAIRAISRAKIGDADLNRSAALTRIVDLASGLQKTTDYMEGAAIQLSEADRCRIDKLCHLAAQLPYSDCPRIFDFLNLYIGYLDPIFYPNQSDSRYISL